MPCNLHWLLAANSLGTRAARRPSPGVASSPMAVRGKVALAWFCALMTFGYGLGDAAVASPGEQAKPPSCQGRARLNLSVQPPLRTDGRWIVDAKRRRVKLAGVNWYGAEEHDEVVGGLDHRPLDRIAACVAAMGFNTVRLPFSNAVVHERRPLAEVAPERT